MLRFSFAVGQHCTGTDAHTEKPATPKRQRALADAAKAGFDERAARTATTTAKKSYLPALAARLTADVTSCRKGHVHCAPRRCQIRRDEQCLSAPPWAPAESESEASVTMADLNCELPRRSRACA
ncbi:hypothetical protein MRX96_029213 [Rhipicephalus microplus]